MVHSSGMFHFEHDEFHSLVWMSLFAGIFGGYWCSCYKKMALDFLTAAGGSAVMALILHWWMLEIFWSVMNHGRNDPHAWNLRTPQDHLSRLCSSQSVWDFVARWVFSILWLMVFYAGGRLRKLLQPTEEEEKERLCQWFQDQIRKAPEDCDRVPRRPGHSTQTEQTEQTEQEHRDSCRQVSQTSDEDDFGMYLLPKDLESMKLKRAKSIPCFNTSTHVVPIRQASLPVAGEQSHASMRRASFPRP